MKSSTLHRSNLTKERMSLIENIKTPENINNSSDINQYMQFEKKPELDVLWRDFEKNIQPKTRAKAPIVYAGVGFVLGLLFALGIAIIVALTMSSDTQKTNIEKQAKIKNDTAAVSVVPAESSAHDEQSSLAGEEKYTIKQGDTLDKIAFRFYGKYDQEKIDKIMKLNNIKDPTKIQIGQVLIIPLN